MVPSLPGPPPALALTHCQALLGLLGGVRQEGGRQRQEALLELMRGNFVGKGDKQEHQKESQGVWRGTRWIKFSSSWEPDEKADSGQLRVLEQRSSAHPPLIRLGSQRHGAVRVWLYLLIGGERTRLASAGPTPCSKPCFAVVTEVLPPPAEGRRTAGHYQLLPEGAGSLCSPKPCSPHPPEVEGWP